MAAVDNPLNGHDEFPAPATGEGKSVSFRLSEAELSAIDAAAADAGKTRSDHIKSRIFGLPTRDRTQLLLVDALHVAGIALLGLLEQVRFNDTDPGHLRAIVCDMRRLVDQIGRQF